MRTIKVIDLEMDEATLQGNAKTVIFNGEKTNIKWHPELVLDARQFHEQSEMDDAMANTIVQELEFEVLHSPGDNLTAEEKVHYREVILAGLV
jgi:hypothetical protein